MAKIHTPTISGVVNQLPVSILSSFTEYSHSRDYLDAMVDLLVAEILPQQVLLLHGLDLGGHPASLACDERYGLDFF